MNDYILLMHADANRTADPQMWSDYFAALRVAGAFQGGSSIGAGQTLRKDVAPAPVTDHLAGYIRIQAPDMAAAKALVAGNPVFECGGTVEIRALTLG
ncbi:MAG TPA: hypothetical protein VHX64_06930 [Caulobacteraceae bacterium]|jgi:hypothetical protein|nr:hypothetical protein [Caulobacteraceae bacterium]